LFRFWQWGNDKLKIIHAATEATLAAM